MKFLLKAFLVFFIISFISSNYGFSDNFKVPVGDTILLIKKDSVIISENAKSIVSSNNALFLQKQNNFLTLDINSLVSTKNSNTSTLLYNVSSTLSLFKSYKKIAVVDNSVTQVSSKPISIPLSSEMLNIPNTTAKYFSIINNAVDVSGNLKKLNSVSSFEENLKKWYAKHSLVPDRNDFVFNKNAIDTFPLPDSIYKQRLDKIPSMVDLVFNEHVKTEIKRYTRKPSRGYIQALIGRAEYYEPIFEEILDSYGVPLEIKHLPIMESAVNPRAVSWAGAAGMWQFMPGTGKMYKLNANNYVDDRRDPVKATHAAAQFLSSLYKRYGDWSLCLAAYNCGPGNVNKAIRRSGGKTSYWEIYNFLPKETRGYVPRFIAVTYLMNYYNEYNMVPASYNLPLITDTVTIENTNLYFSQVSNILNIPIETLRELNPQYKKDIVLAKTTKQSLKLPIQNISQFLLFKDSILSADKTVNQTISNIQPITSTYTPPSTKNKTKFVYTVKSGDNVGYIAQWYGVNSRDISSWNGLVRNRIGAGNKLNIYVANSSASKYKNINTLTFDQKQALSPVKKAVTTNVTKTIDNKYVYYRVRSGDNLWTIAKKYSGVSADNIMALNSINNNSKTRIQVGQLLKIKEKL